MDKYIPQVKTFFIAILLFAESFLLTSLIVTLIEQPNILLPQQGLLPIIGIVMLLMMYTIALSVGAWKNWEQYLLVPLPIVLGIGLVLFPLNPMYTLIIAVNAYILIMYEVYISTSMMNLLIRFKATFVLRSMMKMTFLFVFTIITAVALLLNNYGKEINIDVGKLVSEYAGDPIEAYITGQVTSAGIPEGMLGFMGFDVKKTIETEVNQVIAPYKKLVTPIMAVIAMGWMQLVAIITLTVYGLTINALFALAKKIGFLNIETREVQQEILKF